MKNRRISLLELKIGLAALRPRPAMAWATQGPLRNFFCIFLHLTAQPLPDGFDRIGKFKMNV